MGKGRGEIRFNSEVREEGRSRKNGEEWIEMDAWRQAGRECRPSSWYLEDGESLIAGMVVSSLGVEEQNPKLLPPATLPFQPQPHQGRREEMEDIHSGRGNTN